MTVSFPFADRKINWIQAPGFIRGESKIFSLSQAPRFIDGVIILNFVSEAPLLAKLSRREQEAF